MKLKLPIMTLLLLGCSLLFGQVDETLFGKQGLRLTGAWFIADKGASFFNDNVGLSTGGGLALEFNKNILVGFGGWQTAESVPFGNFSKFNMEHNGLMVGFLPNAHRVFHPKLGFFVGTGNVQVVGGPKDNLFIVKPMAGGVVNLFRWFKLSLEGGYAFVSGSDITNLRDGDLSALSVEMKLRFGWSWGR